LIESNWSEYLKKSSPEAKVSTQVSKLLHREKVGMRGI
jgi:hypothetical protein